MNIAIDCRPIARPETGTMAGIGHYAYELVRHLLKLDDENRYALFFDESAGKALTHEIVGSSPRAVVRLLPHGRAKRLLPYAWSHRVFAAAIAKERPHVFHAVTGSLPLGYKGASVLTAHDLAIYLHPEWFPGGQLFSRRVVVPAGLRRAERIIAVSDATRNDLERLFAVPKEKIRVIHLGASMPEPRAEGGRVPLPERPYFLFLGTVEPRKNVEGLVAAYLSLNRAFPTLAGGSELVIAGAKGWKSDGVYAAIERANRELGAPRIRVEGYVSPARKAALMAHCLAFVFPSRYEGFGLPVLEAMAHGRAVIAGNRGGIPEFAARAALLVDPDHKAELTQAMKLLLEDPARRETLGRKGWERAHEFRWERTAGETLEVYEEAVRTAKS